jgi:hypothetical protein
MPAPTGLSTRECCSDIAGRRCSEEPTTYGSRRNLAKNKQEDVEPRGQPLLSASKIDNGVVRVFRMKKLFNSVDE